MARLFETQSATDLKASLPALLLFTGVSISLICGVTALYTDSLIEYVHVVTNRDFANYWLASKLWLDGNVLDLFRGQEIYFRHAIETYGEDFSWHNWSYPPHFVLLTLPLALIPLPASTVAYELVTLAIFLHAATKAAQRLSGLTAALILPFVLCNILYAQNGFLTGALMLYGLSLRSTSPILAGIALGLLTTKPQLGILIPFLLLAERRWTVIASATLTTVTIVVLSVAMFGIEAWKGYIEHNIPYQTLVMRKLDGTFLEMMPSLYGALRTHGMIAEPAMAIHAPLAIGSVLFFIWTLSSLRRPEARATSLVIATFMITPYSLIYDLGALSVLAAIQVSRPIGTGDARPNLMFIPVCILPIIAQPLAAKGITIAPIVIIMTWASLIYAEYRRGALYTGLKPIAPPAA